MGDWLRDLGHGLRGLRKRPGFAGTVVVTLALGVGANTALFGVFRTVFLEPLPLPDSDELLVVMETAGFGCCGPASGPDYLDWVARSRAFSGLAALSPGSMNLTGVGDPERVYGTRVTASAFPLLGVEPLLGRALLPDDASGEDVVVLSHVLWQRALGGDPDVLGRTLEVDGRPRTVVGVMPPGFDVPSPWARTVRHQLYLPFPTESLQGDRGSHGFPVIARLAPGATVESAQSDMDRVMRELAAEYPRTNAERGAQVSTVHAYLFGDVGRQLGLILGAAAVVLLVACGNVAALQLARAATRENELAVRSALGASRRATIRLLFSESLLLAALGGVGGVLVSLVAVDGLRAVLPATIPRIDAVTIDGPALLFALGVSAVTALAFGMLPSVVGSRTDLATSLREGGHRTLAPGKERLRDAFIVAQIALGLVLANGAGLLVRSYAELRGQEPGFQPEEVTTLFLSPSGPRYESWSDIQAYFEEVAERVGAVPGVEAVGTVTRLPLSGGTNGNVLVEGRGPRSNSDEGPLVELTGVTGEYFAAMGIPLLRGRTLLPDDSASDAVGVVVNQAMADEAWPGEDPLGKRFSFEDDPPDWRTVVGVVGNVRQWGLERPTISQAYVPLTRGWSTSSYLVVRSAGGPGSVTADVRRVLLEVDPTQPPSDVSTMEERVARAFAQRRFYTTLIGLFAGAALLLAAAGVYGTVSYFVARRSREMGIRMALGAGSPGILGLVVRRGLGLAVWGVALGLVGVSATTSLVRGLVYGVSAVDPATLAGGCLVLGAAAVAASALPAARAVRVSPVLALRSE